MMIAYQGEEIKDRHGKVIATVAQDIHTGEVWPRSYQFTMADGTKPDAGALLHEDIMDFIRQRLARGAPERPEPVKKTAPKAPAKKAPAKKKAAKK